MASEGNRKYRLGMVFLIGGFILMGVSLWMDRSGTQIAALAGAIGSVSAGLFGIIWGNAQEHKAKSQGNGGSGGTS